MIYDFDAIIDRSNNHSIKYDARLARFGHADVIPLWIADMDFKAPQPVIDALKSRAEEGIWGYTSRPDTYFQAICGWQQRRHGWAIDPSLVSWALGVVPALRAILKLFVPAGGKVLIQPPVYPEFYHMPETWGLDVLENHFIEQDGHWQLDWADFEDKLRQADLFLLCNPHNPLGIVWQRAELERMVELCRRYGVLLVSDEIHSDLVFHGKKHIPAATVSDYAAKHVITCISGTKTFNLAGLQASTVVFPDLRQKLCYDRFWENLDITLNNAFSLIAMETAFREGEEWLEQLLVYLAGNFDFIRGFCAEHLPMVKPNLPDATYLVWMDFRGLGMGHRELQRFLVEKAGLGLNDGADFCRGLTGFCRLNAACSRKLLARALGQLSQAVSSL